MAKTCGDAVVLSYYTIMTKGYNLRLLCSWCDTSHRFYNKHVETVAGEVNDIRCYTSPCVGDNVKSW